MEAIETYHQAGIVVKMITGDYALTASAIAEQLGLLDIDSPRSTSVITGSELSAMSDTEIKDAAMNASVFLQE